MYSDGYGARVRPPIVDSPLDPPRIPLALDSTAVPSTTHSPLPTLSIWAEKIARNIERDAETTDYLQQAGWTVLRFWEHEDPESVADRVQESVRAARRSEAAPGIVRS